MPRKFPPKNASLQARTSVTSRASTKDSPDWQPANEFSFKSPNSPSPVKRTTRRSSVYKFTATSNSSSAKFRMPIGIKSPPGVKKRARRSSIYQKSATMLSSPPSSRTRRRSMYVSAKPGLQPMQEFSKVWATPIKSVEKIISPGKSSAKKTPKIEKTPVVAVSTVPAAYKSLKTQSPMSVKTTSPEYRSKKTPTKSITKALKTSKGSIKKSPAKNFSKQSQKKADECMNHNTPMSPVKIDFQNSETRKTPKSTNNKSEKITPQEHKRNKTPARSTAKKSSKSSSKKSAAKSASNQKRTPTPVKCASTPITRSQKPTSVSSIRKTTTKKSPKSTAELKSTPMKAKTEDFSSTPSKSVEEISGKSFYSTPKETPVLSLRRERKPVVSARSTKKSSVKRAVIMSPQITPHRRTMKTPKKTPLPKIASTRKRSRNDSAGTLPPSKRVKKSSNTPSLRSAKRPYKKMASKSDSLSPSKTVLTPSEMTSILLDVVETERKEEREASFSQSPGPKKRSRLAEDVVELSTPRVMKEAKRTTSGKLTEIYDRNESCSTVMASSSFLDETVNTDSRSGRCTIL